jgi:hypothetical protein
MSSTAHVYSWKNVSAQVGRFRYVDFLIKSTPAVSLIFIVYITFRGVIW